MLICGPSGSGKTNMLLHMLYKLLEFDKVYLYGKNWHQDKYVDLIEDFRTNLDPKVGYNVIEASNEVRPLEELDPTNQKIAVFDDMLCESRGV